MKTLGLAWAAFAVGVGFAFGAFESAGANVLAFANRTRLPALVKYVGPSTGYVLVEAGTGTPFDPINPGPTVATPDLLPGHYDIRVRYGTPGKFTYQRFEVEVKGLPQEFGPAGGPGWNSRLVPVASSTTVPLEFSRGRAISQAEFESEPPRIPEKVLRPKFKDVPTNSTFFFLSDTNSAFPWVKVSAISARNTNGIVRAISAETPVLSLPSEPPQPSKLGGAN